MLSRTHTTVVTYVNLVVIWKEFIRFKAVIPQRPGQSCLWVKYEPLSCWCTELIKGTCTGAERVSGHVFKLKQGVKLPFKAAIMNIVVTNPPDCCGPQLYIATIFKLIVMYYSLTLNVLVHSQCSYKHNFRHSIGLNVSQVLLMFTTPH